MEADTDNTTIMETPRSVSANVHIVESPPKGLTPVASHNTSVSANHSEARERKKTDTISPKPTTQARFNLHVDNDNEHKYAQVAPKVEPPETAMEKPVDASVEDDKKKKEEASNGTPTDATKEHSKKSTELRMSTPKVDNGPAGPAATATTTARVVNEHEATPDDAESILLSPPPDSLSLNSEAPNEGPEDEIVVKSVKGKSTGSDTPASAAAAAAASVAAATVTGAVGKGDSGEAIDVDHESPAVDGNGAQEPEQRPKRKRASLYDDLAEEKLDRSILDDSIDEPATPVPATATPSRTTADSNVNNNVTNTKGVILGHWRDSDAADGDKHVVKGFIDSRDRLRTRVQPMNRDGKSVANKYPLKPGPGASWVTFQNIVFDDHLVHLDQQQVKEYVKVRAEMSSQETEEEARANDKSAVQQAIQICQSRGPLPESGVQPLIAYGAAVPEHARMGWKRRRTGHSGMSPTTPETPVLPSNNQPVLPARIAPTYQPVQPAPSTHPVPDDLPGHRPTKILLGYWKESAEPLLKDKHAVFGILGNNDMFRVKVGRETRDGRAMQSNFPQGAGALWINSHQWEREDYIADLSREEIKEYCRVRQWQIDHGERPDDVAENRKQAITEARRRTAAGLSKSTSKPNGVSAASSHNQNHAHSAGQNQNHFTDAAAAGVSPASGAHHEAPAHETRRAIARRSGGPPIYPNPPGTRPGSSPQTPSFRAANRSSSSHTVDPRLERASSLALNAVSRIEATQAKVEERDAHRGPPSGGPHGGPSGPNDGGGPPAQGGDAFRESIGRLNNVWSAQEAHRIRTGNEDAKIHMGVKYERKRNGPFAGKLVSQGAIISIDGEDYVEYRVLTKPTFI